MFFLLQGWPANRRSGFFQNFVTSPESLQLGSCISLDFGGFLHTSGFSLPWGGGGTDITFNQPRRCVWVMGVFARKCDGFFVGKNRFVYSPQEVCL